MALIPILIGLILGLTHMKTKKRKVLSITRFKINDNRYAIIVWCKLDSETTHTYRSKKIAITYIVGKQKGLSQRDSKTLISISKKHPLRTAFIASRLDEMVEEAKGNL